MFFVVFFVVLDSLRPATSGDRLPRCCVSHDDIASEVQGERLRVGELCSGMCRAELAWPSLSRSLHSPMHLQCNGKGTKINRVVQGFCEFISDLFWSVKNRYQLHIINYELCIEKRLRYSLGAFSEFTPSDCAIQTLRFTLHASGFICSLHFSAS